MGEFELIQRFFARPARRAALGMPPLAEYTANMQDMYATPKN